MPTSGIPLRTGARIPHINYVLNTYPFEFVNNFLNFSIKIHRLYYELYYETSKPWQCDNVVFNLHVCAIATRKSRRIHVHVENGPRAQSNCDANLRRVRNQFLRTYTRYFAVKCTVQPCQRIMVFDRYLRVSSLLLFFQRFKIINEKSYFINQNSSRSTK